MPCSLAQFADGANDGVLDWFFCLYRGSKKTWLRVFFVGANVHCQSPVIECCCLCWDFLAVDQFYYGRWLVWELHSSQFIETDLVYDKLKIQKQ